jgi:hypothetical protein
VVVFFPFLHANFTFNFNELIPFSAIMAVIVLQFCTHFWLLVAIYVDAAPHWTVFSPLQWPIVDSFMLAVIL